MVRVFDDTEGVPVGHNKGRSFCTSECFFVSAGYTGKVLECMQRVDCSDVVFVWGTRFDAGQPVGILRDKPYGGIGSSEKHLVLKHIEPFLLLLLL